MTRRSIVRIAAGAALLALLAGCVRIPLDGPVGSVEIDTGSGGDDLLVVPEGPTAGMTPREILQGFIRAGRGPQNGYGVAAEYLTDELRAEWRPSGVLITTSAIAPEAVDEDSLRLTLSVDAELDARGRYTDAPAESTRTLEFEFAQVDGEWRISAAPDGTVLAPSSFDDIFEPVELYYYSADYRFLVPELRWFLDNPRTLANRIVDELLAGTSPLLESGVLVTAFPSGVDRTDPVDVDSGVAVVPLSSGVIAEGTTSQARMLQQLSWSVGSLANVSDAAIVSGGFPAAIPDVARVDRTQIDPVPVGYRDGTFGTLAGDGVSPIGAVSGVVEALEPIAVTLGRERDSAAVLSAAGVSVVRDGEAVLRDPREGLVAPALDPWGWVWSVPADDPAALRVFGPGGGEFDVPLEMEGRIAALEVSRDGTRLLVAVQTTAGPRVVVWGIVRDGELAPDALVEPQVVPEISGDVLDAGWVDGGTIALLTRSGAVAEVTTAALGGRVSSLGPVSDGVQLVGGNGSSRIRVLTAEGSVLSPSGGENWLDTGLDASFLATQQ